MNKKFKALILSTLLFTAFIAIYKTNITKSNKFQISILQLVEHDALDQAKLGFLEGLTDVGLTNDKITVNYENAQGDQSNCYLLANKFINQKSDLILAIGTPAAQAIANATKNIPILVTAITSPESVGLVKSNINPQTNVTGTSDLAPIDKQISLIKQLKPSTNILGILYCSNEPNSAYQAELAKIEAKKLNLKTKIFTVSSSNEVPQVVQNMAQSVDFIYTPTDNLIASSMPTISSIATSANIPIVCGETNVVKNGSIGTYGMDYYELGKITARQAKEILIDKKQPQSMPIEYLENNKLTLNQSIINKLNISIPEHLKNFAEYININQN